MNTPRMLSHNWSPASVSPMNQLHDEIDRLFNNSFGGFFEPWGNFPSFKTSRRALDAVTISPSVELSSDDKAYTLSVELPGVDPADVKLEIQDNMLTLSGEKKHEFSDAPKAEDKAEGEAKDEGRRYHVTERAYGSFQRSMSLPEDADAEAITATHKDGVLTVLIPRKKEEAPKCRAIEVTRA